MICSHLKRHVVDSNNYLALLSKTRQLVPTVPGHRDSEESFRLSTEECQEPDFSSQLKQQIAAEQC